MSSFDLRQAVRLLPSSAVPVVPVRLHELCHALDHDGLALKESVYNEAADLVLRIRETYVAREATLLLIPHRRAVFESGYITGDVLLLSVINEQRCKVSSAEERLAFLREVFGRTPAHATAFRRIVWLYLQRAEKEWQENQKE